MTHEKICEFCESSGNISTCKARGARQRGKYTVSSTESCRPDPKELTREQFRMLATPLLDEQDYMDTTLYNNEMLLGRPDGIHTFPDTQDAISGNIIAEIEHGRPIGVLGVYGDTIKNVAVDKENRSILPQLIKIAVEKGARKFEEVFQPDMSDMVYDFYNSVQADDTLEIPLDIMSHARPESVKLQQVETGSLSVNELKPATYVAQPTPHVPETAPMLVKTTTPLPTLGEVCIALGMCITIDDSIKNIRNRIDTLVAERHGSVR